MQQDDPRGISYVISGNDIAKMNRAKLRLQKWHERCIEIHTPEDLPRYINQRSFLENSTLYIVHGSYKWKASAWKNLATLSAKDTILYWIDTDKLSPQAQVLKKAQKHLAYMLPEPRLMRDWIIYTGKQQTTPIDIEAQAADNLYAWHGYNSHALLTEIEKIAVVGHTSVQDIQNHVPDTKSGDYTMLQLWLHKDLEGMLKVGELETPESFTRGMINQLLYLHKACYLNDLYGKIGTRRKWGDKWWMAEQYLSLSEYCDIHTCSKALKIMYEDCKPWQHLAHINPKSWVRWNIIHFYYSTMSSKS